MDIPENFCFRIRTQDNFACVGGAAKIIFTAMQINKTAATVFTALDDGTGVLLNLETRAYYSLNRTGSRLWKLIEEVEAVSLDDLVMLTCERFEVSQEQARQALLAYVDRLDKFKMIRLS